MIKRLNENKGVTILYALFGLLVFMLVATVIFNAANSNYVRFRNEADRKQAEITVNSAADFFVDAIAGDKVTFCKTLKNYDGKTKYDFTNIKDVAPTDPKYVDIGTPMPISNQFKFSDILYNMVYDYYLHGKNITSYNTDYKIHVSIKENSGDTEEVILEDINVYLQMGYDMDSSYGLNDYDLVAVFYNNDIEDRYCVTVLIPFVRDTTSQKPVLDEISKVYYQEDKTQLTDVIYKVEWDAGNVSVSQGNIYGVTLNETN